MPREIPLPDGWIWTLIGDIVTFEYGKGLTEAKRDKNGKIPVYGSNGIVGYHSIPLVEEPCLIVGRKGAAGAVHKSDVPCWPIDTTYYVIPPENINISFLFYLFLSLKFVSLDRSTAIPGLNRNDAYAVNIPLPPLPEQERIVARIESLFTQLDAGVAALRRVQAALKRYRASVLKAACEGRLVPQDPNDEPAEELLHRLGKSPQMGEDLSSLPEGWCWATTEQLADGSKYALKAGPFGSSLKKEFYVPKGFKIYGQEQVIRGDSNYGDYYIDNERYEQLKSNAVKPGDILISLVGTIGKVLILPEDIKPGIINPRLVKLSLDKRLIESKYFKMFMETETVRHFYSTTSHGETMEILNLSILRQMSISLPPLKEQRRIVGDVDQRLSVVQELDQTVSTSLKRAARLRQAILKRAFEGKLVPQNPQNEPVGAPLVGALPALGAQSDPTES